MVLRLALSSRFNPFYLLWLIGYFCRMKCSFLYIVIIVIIASLSCKNTTSKTNNISVDTIHFFSIKDFILSEVKDVQTTPYAMYQITSQPTNSKDSTLFTKENFATAAQQFIACDINNSALKSGYKESVFKDNSTESITLNYNTANQDLPIQNIDVLLNETTNKVSRIFIRKRVDNKDSLITVLYSWKAGKSFSIIKSVFKKDGSKYDEQRFVNWNDRN